MDEIVSVNIGLPRDVKWRGKTVRTAIWKAPVNGRVLATRHNLIGDAQADLSGHGEEQRAVMAYQLTSYRYWENHLRRSDFVYGNSARILQSKDSRMTRSASADVATGRLIWTNFAHLFSVSLMPFSTAWIAQTELAEVPVSYAGAFVLVNATYLLLCAEVSDRPQSMDVPARTNDDARPLFGNSRNLCSVRGCCFQISAGRNRPDLLLPDRLSPTRGAKYQIKTRSIRCGWKQPIINPASRTSNRITSRSKTIALTTQPVKRGNSHEWIQDDG